MAAAPVSASVLVLQDAQHLIRETVTVLRRVPVDEIDAVAAADLAALRERLERHLGIEPAKDCETCMASGRLFEESRGIVECRRCHGEGRVRA